MNKEVFWKIYFDANSDIELDMITKKEFAKITCIIMNKITIKMLKSAKSMTFSKIM